MQENYQHSVSIEQRKKLSVNGVESVAAFSEVKIVLALGGGERMQVAGSGLKITGFSTLHSASAHSFLLSLLYVVIFIYHNLVEQLCYFSAVLYRAVLLEGELGSYS